MDKDSFLSALRDEVATYKAAISTHQGDWIVKGFVDTAKNVYTISLDTKVISKVLELLMLPKLANFAEKHKLEIIFPRRQNFYPDISFVNEEGHRFALDLKSTYRIDNYRVSGFTLGAFTGYFRKRDSTKSITFPYRSYVGYFVLGVIYSRTEELIDENKIYSIDEIERMSSVINNFQFFVHEKYMIASDHPGSGNTKNIGSIREIDKLVNGSGPFASLGETAFDDYWMNYLTKDMVRKVNEKQPDYTDLDGYLKSKGIAR